jgi:hypothetical protein
MNEQGQNVNKLANVRFNGKSGTRYAFTAYPLGTVFSEGFGGVYVVTRRREGKSSRFVHRKIHTGQSEDFRQPLASDDGTFSAKGANCICVLAEKDKDARQKIELDLVREPRA